MRSTICPIIAFRAPPNLLPARRTRPGFYSTPACAAPTPGVAANAANDDFASDSSWACSNVKQDNWETRGFIPDNWAAGGRAGGYGDRRHGECPESYLAGKLAGAYPGNVRAALVAADPLMVALARPNREQVVTTRPTAATTLQALELTNGETLADVLKRGAENLLTAPSAAQGDLIPTLYEKALGRKPTGPELQLAREMVGQPVQPAGVEDLLWSVAMLPEFQLHLLTHPCRTLTYASRFTFHASTTHDSPGFHQDRQHRHPLRSGGRIPASAARGAGGEDQTDGRYGHRALDGRRDGQHGDLRPEALHRVCAGPEARPGVEHLPAD